MRSKTQPTKLISAAKLRVLADAIERDVLRHVAELRRLADLADGVKALAIGQAKPVKAKKKLVVRRVKRRVAKKVVRKTKRAAPARRGR